MTVDDDDTQLIVLLKRRAENAANMTPAHRFLFKRLCNNLCNAIDISTPSGPLHRWPDAGPCLDLDPVAERLATESIAR
jgi:hypothetical protein